MHSLVQRFRFHSFFLLTFAFLGLVALPAAASPHIAVYRSWDNVQLANNDSVTYDPTPINTAESRLFRITNSGNATLTLSVDFSSYYFSVIESPASSVAAGQSTTMRIRLYGDRPSYNYGYVTLTTNDPSQPTFDFSVQGQISGPLFDLQQNWTGLEQANGSTFTFDPVTAGTSASRVFRITNAGNQNLTLSNPTTIVSGTGFSEIEFPATSTLIPSDYTTFRVRFLPGSPGSYSGTITIYSNDPPRSPYVVHLSGTAN